VTASVSTISALAGHLRSDSPSGSKRGAAVDGSVQNGVDYGGGQSGRESSCMRRTLPHVGAMIYVRVGSDPATRDGLGANILQSHRP
jgi:hypothetical protein